MEYNVNSLFEKIAEPVDMVDLPDEFDTNAEPPEDLQDGGGADMGADMGGGGLGGDMGDEMGGGMGGDAPPSAPQVDWNQFFYNRTDELDNAIEFDEDYDINYSEIT